VLPVAEALRTAALHLAGYDGGNVTVIPTGYDSGQWHPSGPKERSVLCVAGCTTRARLLIKGIDLFFAAARELKGERFILVGTPSAVLSRLGEPVPPNVQVVPPVAREELTSLYQGAKVCVQPSRSEGLPNAVCEAMLSGCLPVATDVGGTSAAIGETGCRTCYDVPGLVGAIRDALQAPEDHGARARERIITLYPVEQRMAALTQLLSGDNR
jgi:glycosyltransferase involved in cell wall biosynthesis